MFNDIDSYPSPQLLPRYLSGMYKFVMGIVFHRVVTSSFRNELKFVSTNIQSISAYNVMDIRSLQYTRLIITARFHQNSFSISVMFSIIFSPFEDKADRLVNLIMKLSGPKMLKGWGVGKPGVLVCEHINLHNNNSIVLRP